MIDLDPARVNPNGGAIALGHPISATGAIITAKILSEMERQDHKLGLVTLCIGGGQSIAMLLGRDVSRARRQAHDRIRCVGDFLAGR